MTPQRRIDWVLSLSNEDLLTLAEALDSHVYWQLADPRERSHGRVLLDRVEEPERRAELEHIEAIEQTIRSLVFAG